MVIQQMDGMQVEGKQTQLRAHYYAFSFDGDGSKVN